MRTLKRASRSCTPPAKKTDILESGHKTTPNLGRSLWTPTGSAWCRENYSRGTILHASRSTARHDVAKQCRDRHIRGILAARSTVEMKDRHSPSSRLPATTPDSRLLSIVVAGLGQRNPAAFLRCISNGQRIVARRGPCRNYSQPTTARSTKTGPGPSRRKRQQLAA